jgi:hypothetical protein
MGQRAHSTSRATASDAAFARRERVKNAPSLVTPEIDAVEAPTGHVSGAPTATGSSDRAVADARALSLANARSLDGTPFARRSDVTSTEGRFAAIRAAQLRAVGTVWVRKRPWFGLALMLYVMSTLVFVGFPRWRVLAVGALYCASICWQLRSSMRARYCVVEYDSIFKSHLVLYPVVLGVIVLTGGLRSPLIVALFGIPTGTLVTYGRSRQSTIAVAFASVSTIAIALLPEAWLGPSIRHPFDIALTAGAFVFSFLMMHNSINYLSDAYRGANQTID